MKLSSMIHAVYEKTGSQASSDFSMASVSLLGKIGSNFKVPSGLPIAGKIFRLSKVVKSSHLYKLDAHYLSLVGYTLEFQDVWCDLCSAKAVGVFTSQQQFIVLPYGKIKFGKRKEKDDLRMETIRR